MVRKILFAVLIILIINTTLKALEPNPLKLLIKTTLYIYQKYITNQDVQECQFSPSCSEFSRQAFRLTNPIKATLMTSDRLQRCHPLAHLYYPKTMDNIYLLDPPNRYLDYKKRGE